MRPFPFHNLRQNINHSAVCHSVRRSVRPRVIRPRSSSHHAFHPNAPWLVGPNYRSKSRRKRRTRGKQGSTGVNRRQQASSPCFSGAFYDVSSIAAPRLPRLPHRRAFLDPPRPPTPSPYKLDSIQLTPRTSLSKTPHRTNNNTSDARDRAGTKGYTWLEDRRTLFFFLSFPFEP